MAGFPFPKADAVHFVVIVVRAVVHDDVEEVARHKGRSIFYFVISLACGPAMKIKTFNKIISILKEDLGLQNFCLCCEQKKINQPLGKK